MIRAARDADSRAEIELEPRAQIQIDGRDELLLLLEKRIEARDRAHFAVVFETCRDLFAQIVADLEIRRELDSFVHVRPVKSAIELMQEKGFRRLLLTRNGRAVGMVNQYDLFLSEELKVAPA